MNEKQRAEFEKWFTSQIDSEYCSPNVKALMAGCWKAAIASVVVGLPKPTWNDGYNIGDVKQAIENSGVRYE